MACIDISKLCVEWKQETALGGANCSFPFATLVNASAAILPTGEAGGLLTASLTQTDVHVGYKVQQPFQGQEGGISKVT